MNYGIDTAKAWCYLVGIYPGQNNQICGHMQLFFIEKRQQQILDGGYAATFTDMPVTDVTSHKNSLFCFCQKKPGEAAAKLHIMEIGNPAAGQQKHKRNADVQMQDGDFPVLMHDCPKYGVLFMISKLGFLYMYEVSSAALLYRQ
jgi:clathrin heavy chain